MNIRTVVLCVMLGALLACDRDKPTEIGSQQQEEIAHDIVQKVAPVDEQKIDDIPVDMPTEMKEIIKEIPSEMGDAEPMIGDAGQQLDNVAPLDLARASGCLACHGVEKKIVGPAWKDVAVRYQNEAGVRVRLIEKVKKGGSGNWADVTGGIKMPPYSPRVKDHDIERLVDYVLSLAQ